MWAKNWIPPKWPTLGNGLVSECVSLQCKIISHLNSDNGDCGDMGWCFRDKVQWEMQTVPLGQDPKVRGKMRLPCRARRILDVSIFKVAIFSVFSVLKPKLPQSNGRPGKQRVRTQGRTRATHSSTTEPLGWWRCRTCPGMSSSKAELTAEYKVLLQKGSSWKELQQRQAEGWGARGSAGEGFWSRRLWARLP